jgi:hypothetical protein
MAWDNSQNRERNLYFLPHIIWISIESRDAYRKEYLDFSLSILVNHAYANDDSDSFHLNKLRAQGLKVFMLIPRKKRNPIIYSSLWNVQHDLKILWMNFFFEAVISNEKKVKNYWIINKFSGYLFWDLNGYLEYSMRFPLLNWTWFSHYLVSIKMKFMVGSLEKIEFSLFIMGNKLPIF